jgi:NADPH:quinone reductase-like Zn-dependent oxidoreductase
MLQRIESTPALTTHMKALVYQRYGAPSVIEIAKVERPTPRRDEVLIRVVASTVSAADWRARSLQMPPGFGLLGRLFFGVFGPRKKVLGTELSGVVEAVGSAVKRFKAGDEVFAFTGASYGCHSEWRVLPENGMVVTKPANLSFEQAAALSFGGTTALCFLRDMGGLERGDKVLVVGASGAIGSAAVQIAKYFGAEVTGVCSTSNLEVVRSLGADHVIDYTQQDFARNGERYDLILETTGSAPFARCAGSLTDHGRLLVVLGSFAQALGLERPPRGSGKKVIASLPRVTRAHLELLAELARAGRYQPLIDSIHPMTEAALAHARVDSGRKRGNVVLRIASSRK